MVFGFITAAEGAYGPSIAPWQADQMCVDWRNLFATLVGTIRATAVTIPGGETLWVAAERQAEMCRRHPEAGLHPGIAAVDTDAAADAQTALTELIRLRLDGLGLVTAEQFGAPLGLPAPRVLALLSRLEGEGFALPVAAWE